MEEQNQTPAAPQKKSNLKNILILVGAIILIFALSAAGLFLFNSLRSGSTTEQANSDEQATQVSQEPTRTPSIEATYTCADNKTIQVAFYNEGDFPSATVNLSDGTSATLYQVESASGARYANADESMVFWNTGNTAFVEENGVETYSDCVQES